MMLASLKLLLSVLCLVCTLFLYTHDHLSTLITKNHVAPPIPSETTISGSQSSTPQNALPSNDSFIPTDTVLDSANGVTNVSEEERPRVLQATMMFGSKYLGLNERTLQSHIDHAKRWGYGNHILRQEIVGAGQWDKFIFCKILHIQDLIIGELKRSRGERAEWVV